MWILFCALLWYDVKTTSIDLYFHSFYEVPYQHFLDISKDGITFIFLKNSNTKAILWKKIPQADAECIDFYQNPKFLFFSSFFPFVLWYRIFFSKSTNDDRSDNITFFLSGKMLLVYYPCQDIDFSANRTWWVRWETTSSFCFHNLTIWPDIWGYESASRRKFEGKLMIELLVIAIYMYSVARKREIDYFDK